ncbi:MAG: hypothetical protein ACR2N4_01595 [Jatrophihabitans sp.]
MNESSNDPSNGWAPTPERPWRPVRPDQVVYLFDYGQPWCNDRAGHPQHQPDSYPSLNHHVTECRSYGGWFEGWFEDARAGLNGPPGYLSAYLVRPFRHGQTRWADDEDRLAFEFVPRDNGNGEPFRCSIPASTIRNLVAHLAQTADVADGWRPPRKVRSNLTD